MYIAKKVIEKVILIFILCVSNSLGGFSQNVEMDSLQSMLRKLPPEQVDLLLNTALNGLPPEKRAEMEETILSIKSTTPEVRSIKLRKKTVAFVPLTHVSTPKFYEGVKRIVNEYKNKGYVVFFEELKEEKDPHAQDTLQRKLRKIVGFEPNRETYSFIKTFFPEAIPQPKYQELGITAFDVNADISVRQFVEQYEKMYEPVHLSNCDFETPLGSLLYPCEKLDNDLNPIVMDYRNEDVSGLIKSSRNKKILVLYGAWHIDGIMELIRK
jgi:hypothetical protein